MKKSITKDFKINVLIEWECPHCHHNQFDEYSGSPYRIIAEDPGDVTCEKCSEFVTLNFYEND